MNKQIEFEAKIRVSPSEVFPDKVVIEIRSKEVDTEVYDDYNLWRQLLEQKKVDKT